MQRLADGLVDRFLRQAPAARRHQRRLRSKMSDVVNPMLMQTDALHEINLDFIGCGQSADESRHRCAAMLRCRRVLGECCRQDGNNRRRGKYRDNRAHARQRRWPMRAHSGENRASDTRPNTVAPGLNGWAWAFVTGVHHRAAREAAATAALSIIRLPIISTTASSTGTGSAATAAICQASCSLRGNLPRIYACELYGPSQYSSTDGATVKICDPDNPQKLCRLHSHCNDSWKVTHLAYHFGKLRGVFARNSRPIARSETAAATKKAHRYSPVAT